MSPRPGGFSVAGGLLALAAIVFLGLPVVVLVGRSLGGGSLWGALGASSIAAALAVSLVTTAVSLALTVGFGTPLAFVLARRRFRGTAILEAAVDLPIVLPPSVAGLALLLAFGRHGLLGPAFEAAGVQLAFTTAAVIMAQTFVSAPFFVRAARAGFQGIDRDLEDAARVDGAGEGAVFRRIVLPLAGPALAAGLVMSWARAMGEFGATIMFAGSIEGITQTLPLVVYSEFQSSLDASIAAVAILVLAAFGVLLSVRLIHWRSVFAVGSFA